MLDKLRSLLPSRQAAAPAAPAGETLLFNAYCTRVQIPKPPFAHVLHLRRDLSDPELLAHLNEFCGYVLDRGDGQMSRDKYHVILHLQRVQHHLAISIGADDTAALYRVGEGSQRGAVHQGRPCARRRWPCAGRRKRRQHRCAGAHAVSGRRRGPARRPARRRWPRAGSWCRITLPPLISEDELVLQDRDESSGRARALLLIALRAESVASGEPMSADTLLSKMPLADDHLSPDERAFLALETPSQQECAQFMWRYESLYLLEWVLGMVDELPFPAEACDTASTVAKLIEMRGPSVRAGRRDPRCARPDLPPALAHPPAAPQEAGATPGADADVVMERHHALNWLVRFQHAGWDQVDTPT